MNESISPGLSRSYLPMSGNAMMAVAGIELHISQPHSRAS